MVFCFFVLCLLFLSNLPHLQHNSQSATMKQKNKKQLNHIKIPNRVWSALKKSILSRKIAKSSAIVKAIHKFNQQNKKGTYWTTTIATANQQSNIATTVQQRQQLTTAITLRLVVIMLLIFFTTKPSPPICSHKGCTFVFLTCVCIWSCLSGEGCIVDDLQLAT